MLARTAAVAIVALALLGALTVRQKPSPDVVLISLDTVRADRTSALFPNGRATTPNLARLPGIRFRNCWAHAPYTSASHATLLSGRYASAIHYGVAPRYFAAKGPVLPEILHDVGYHTVAITAGGFMGKRWGVARGFDHFEECAKWEVGEEIGRARTWLARWARKARRRETTPPVFLFVHSFLAHAPYLSTRWGTAISDRYDGDIREADVIVGVVWDAMQRLRLARNRGLILVVVADHGEEMGDHGLWGFHAQNLYREVLHVPCVWAEPGLSPRMVDARVGLIDVVPSLLDRLGLPVPPEIDGVSLVPLIDGERWDHGGRVLFAARPKPPDLMGYRAMADEGTYIEDVGRPVTYFAPSDPKEKKNTWNASDPVQRKLADVTQAFRRRWMAESAPEPTYDPTTRAKLEALGYVLGVDQPPARGKNSSTPPAR